MTYRDIANDIRTEQSQFAGKNSEKLAAKVAAYETKNLKIRRAFAESIERNSPLSAQTTLSLRQEFGAEYR
jgi:hypothetical protein